MRGISYLFEVEAGASTAPAPRAGPTGNTLRIYPNKVSLPLESVRALLWWRFTHFVVWVTQKNRAATPSSQKLNLDIFDFGTVI